MFRYGDVVCLCESCGSSQCCILHDLQFVNAGREYKRRPYRRGILQSRSQDCLIGKWWCGVCWCATCGSGILSSTDDVLGMSGVGGVGEMCMCLARGSIGEGGVWVEWMRGLCLGFNKPVGTWEVFDVCLGFCGVGGIAGELIGVLQVDGYISQVTVDHGFQSWDLGS